MKFLNCRISITQKVFSPRIETEFWVERALREIKKDKKFKFLDIFSGTGCMGISILKSFKKSQADFIDISREAILQIKENLKKNKIDKKRYRVLQSDLFKKTNNLKYDYIFANPPYVAQNRIKEVQKEVLKKDPHLALFSGKEGMDCIRKFVPQARKHLKKGGVIFMEFDPLQKKEIGEILKREGFKFSFKKDQFKKYRWLKAELKN
ncbi:MAG: HemK family protein methyltransferase [Candidatus Pacebacteria bacterium]|nr:HemK family protein methyltransferase [Candidatus Paceibacterota bacterium]